MKFLLLLLLLELSLFASIGKISALNGKVVVDRQKQLLDANIGFDLEEKDLILTDDKSKAQITLNDGTVLSLGKNSKLNINEYVFDENNSSNSKAEFKFVEGTFKSITGAIGKVAPEKFKLETKSASIGIRGTIVVGNQEKVACTQGQITVTSAGVTQVLGAGMMTNTEIGKAPTPPAKIEGNLLKEVDNIGNKEESKSTTSETKEKTTSEEKTSENNKSDKSNEKEQTTTQTSSSTEQNNAQPVQQSSSLQTSSLSQNTNNVSNNVSTFTEVTNTVNTTITQTSSNKIQEDIADAKKKAEVIDAATILSNEANTIAQSVATASINASSASTSVSSIAQGSTDTQITTAVTNATTASTSASTLSSQAQTLKTEIATLLVQAQNANANEVVVIYEQIRIKSNLLNTKLTEATSLVTTAQNSLKTVSVNLASSLSNEANTIAQSVAVASTNVSSSSISATQLAQGVSVSEETQMAINTVNSASSSASTLSSQAQTLKAEIGILLSQAQNANANEVVAIYEQIKTKTNSLNTISTQVTDALITAQNSLKTVSANLASSLSNEANTIAQSVAVASTNVSSASISATQLAQGVSVSEETQIAINTVNSASSNATTLSSQAQTLKTEIATLLVQAQNANANEVVVIYEQIRIKSNLLNTKLTEATSLVTTAQNSLKTVSVNLASSLSNEANTTVKILVTTASNVQLSANSASTIAQGSTDSQITTAVTNATTASSSASTLSSQAQTLKAEIGILLSQAQNANANEVVAIYEQIKTKTNSLNTISTQVTDALITAQNSLKTVSVNLASSLSSQANTIIETITSQASNTLTSANTVSQLLENASTSALAEVNTFSNGITQSEETINSLSMEAQTLKDDITRLLNQAQNASSSEAVSIYEQIKTARNSLNSLLTQAEAASFNASTIAQNISNAIVNVPVYSASIDVLNSNSGVGSKIFTVPSGGSTVTMATYGSSDGIWNGENSSNRSGFDPVLILLKWNNGTSKYEYVSDSRKDDNWIVADNFYNSILNITLAEGNYKVLVADYPFSISEALKDVNRGTSEEENVKIYFTSTSNLTFDTTDAIAIEKYSYITRMNNKAYINSLNYQTASIQDANPKFGILANSNVGTTIKIDDYGYFVTISDSFDNSKNAFLNSSEIDDESSWGYWTQTLQSDSSESSINMKSSWVSGNQVTAPTNYKATFQGQVIGGVKNGSDTGYIKLDSDNIFKATIDVGAATITNSLIQFKDSLSNSWSGTFNASGTVNVNQQGFASSIIGAETTGSLAGKYYGTTNADSTMVKSVGGSFNMIKGESSIANGVFKAREVLP